MTRVKKGGIIITQVSVTANLQKGELKMAGEFGKFINEKRKGRGQGGSDVLLRDLAEAMGNMSVSYLSDIIKGRRNPPEKKLLEIIAMVLKLNADECDEMYDLAGREREEAAPDLPDYIMDEKIPHVRTALRTAKKAGLGDEFWQQVNADASKGSVDWSKTTKISQKSEQNSKMSPVINEVIEKAKNKGLGDEFWQRVIREIDEVDNNGK